VTPCRGAPLRWHERTPASPGMKRKSPVPYSGMARHNGGRVLLRKARLCRPIRAPRDGAGRSPCPTPGSSGVPGNGSAAVARGYANAARPKNGRATRSTGSNFASGRSGAVLGSGQRARAVFDASYIASCNPPASVRNARVQADPFTRPVYPVYPTRLPDEINARLRSEFRPRKRTVKE
jgi:hypothetical protein